MHERVVLFHRQFPDKRIAVTSLRRLYIKLKIQRKKVRQEKVLPPHLRAEFRDKCRDLLFQLEEAEAEGRLIVFLDETNFTKLSLPRKEWSTRNSNLTVDQVDVYQGYRSVIAAMTAEHGMLPASIYMKAISQEDFVSYLRRLRKRFKNRPIALFQDNLSVHKAKSVKEEY